MFFPILAAVLALSCHVLADPVPTAPDSSSIFNEGTTCSIQWTPDTTGDWKNMSIELMTGDNFKMIHLSTIATLDGTDASKTPLTYPCLKVKPNSAIYFYQFTSPNAPNTTWTTRFTLAGPNGETTPPANPTQPTTNAPIAWGTGALQNPADGTPPPAKAGSAIGGTSSSSNSTTSTTGTITTTSSTGTTSLPSTNTSIPVTTSRTSSSSAASNTTTTTNTTSDAMTIVAANLALAAPLLSILFSL